MSRINIWRVPDCPLAFKTFKIAWNNVFSQLKQALSFEKSNKLRDLCLYRMWFFLGTFLKNSANFSIQYISIQNEIDIFRNQEMLLGWKIYDTAQKLYCLFWQSYLMSSVAQLEAKIATEKEEGGIFKIIYYVFSISDITQK